jgi:tRNA pseudouridine32 synthase/23S rRNA pseudouridine746 synthase
MFGVLVCEDEEGQLGFLAAYSGQIGGHEDWPWFVPAVFDYLQPTGYFKQEESQITDINHRVQVLENSVERQSLQHAVSTTKQQASTEIDAYKSMMQQAKARRDALRTTSGETEEMIRESQFQKAELRRLKKQWNDKIAETEVQLKPLDDQLLLLKRERKQRSDQLQRWLFDHFLMANTLGKTRSLTDIFSTTPQGVPPSGSGECCAPKLLQYAYQHHLRPLCIAEFWQGRSPKMEIRHHDQFYTACRGKCKPILEWMLPIASIDSIATIDSIVSIDTIAKTSTFLVIFKPAGLLSVPGLTDAPSVESILKAQYPEVHMVHRLDMDTSGVMVVALTLDAYHSLQQQFLKHQVQKEYVALLENDVEGSGEIDLPLRPDLLDRPRQVVDPENGKSALTTYQALGLRRIRLIPHTGRTHQLRVHCAHHLGLNNPILGDPLYGTEKADRLYLHAETLSFDDPETGERRSFHYPAPF